MGSLDWIVLPDRVSNHLPLYREYENQFVNGPGSGATFSGAFGEKGMFTGFATSQETSTPCSEFYHLLLPIQIFTDTILLVSMQTHKPVRF